MSSVQNYVPCPQCENLAVYIFTCGIGDVYLQCAVCGYYYEVTAIHDRKRQAGDPENREFYKLTKDGYHIHRTIKKKGYGAYYIKCKTGACPFGCFHEPITSEDIEWFNDIISSPDIDSEGSYLTRWNDEINKSEAVVGVIMNPCETPEDEDELDINTESEDPLEDEFDLCWL